MKRQNQEVRYRSSGGVASALSLGSRVILGLAAISSLFVLTSPIAMPDGLRMWTFARAHYLMYEPAIERLNSGGGEPVNVNLLSLTALQQRMLSGFLSGTPVADLIEVERTRVGSAFAGPLEDVGFLDLTDRLESEGLMEQINGPSFTPWMSRGRVFGLPHDVHPVLLVYRADIVEEAGIDVSQIETWEDFRRVLSPLMEAQDDRGRPQHYLLNLWPQQLDTVEALIRQAGGSYFDSQDNVAINTPRNADVLATIATWFCGPNRMAIDAEEFTPSGNRLKLEGRVIASLMPDWLSGVWKNDMPQLRGKLKLMPLPAWERGGRRTSVWGGTMLGVTRTSKNVDRSWEAAKRLYLSKDIAEELYTSNGIISPVKSFWEEPFYAEPDDFFCGQSPGSMYIAMAPDVPRRTSSPYTEMARQRVRGALIALYEYANRNELFTSDELLPEAKRQLQRAHDSVKMAIDRNLFLGDDL